MCVAIGGGTCGPKVAISQELLMHNAPNLTAVYGRGHVHAGRALAPHFDTAKTVAEPKKKHGEKHAKLSVMVEAETLNQAEAVERNASLDKLSALLGP